ncbi:hypothetical protein QEZ52_20810 (plasmid) [Aliisedimentitalea scapharcae]|uniref:Uncharacterized protein n=1 Tax=Aliisedimentitalea scapharcae TaxID=1524259 RepID=A0ABZ2Y295_9RHOB
MGLEDTIQKLDKYLKRLKKGKTKKIKPAHLEKIKRKLTTKQDMLKTELAETTKPSKRERLEGKLQIVQEQLGRAHWLSQQLSEP